MILTIYGSRLQPTLESAGEHATKKSSKLQDGHEMTRRDWERVIGRALIGALAPAGRCGQDDSHDREFEKVPFEQWFEQQREDRFKWKTRVLPTRLSAHQRLVVPLEIEIDGSEISKRRGAGRLVFFFQIKDERGYVYQQHGEFDLEQVEGSMKHAAAVCSDHAFVAPGDYMVSFAVLHTGSGEHARKRMPLHVEPLADGSLPELWRDLPRVWFFSSTENPDAWFQPKDHARLHLPMRAERPVDIEVVANLQASEGVGGGFRPKSSDLASLLPYLKVLSCLSGADVRKTFSMVDLPRRRVVFEQRDAEELDWPRMRAALSRVSSGLIDRASLAARAEVASFFVEEVGRRLATDAGGRRRVVIVLSGPMVFASDQKKPEVVVRTDGDHRLIYLRMRSKPELQQVFSMDGSDAGATPAENRRSNGRDRVPEATLIPEYDELARLFAGSGMRLFDIPSAGAFRLALASIVREL